MEENLKTTAEHSGDERHSGEHHRHHSHHRHRSHRSYGENLEGKRESWRKPRQRHIWRRRIASAAFIFLSILAVILMAFVAYIYMF